MDMQQVARLNAHTAQYNPVLLKNPSADSYSSSRSTALHPRARARTSINSIQHLRQFIHITKSYAPLRRDAILPFQLRDVPIHIASFSRMDLLYRVVSLWTHANTLLAAKSGSDARVRLMGPLLEAFEALLVPSAFDDGIRAMEALGYGDETGLGRSIRGELVDTLSDGDPVLQVFFTLYDRPTVQCYSQWAQQVIETASSTVNAHSPAVQTLVDESRHLLTLLSLRQTYPRSIVPMLVFVSCSVVLLEQALDSGDTWTIFGRWMNEKEELCVDVPVDDRTEMGTTTGKPKL